MKYDPEKHHRRSIRLLGYDYSQVGAYFVTICTKDRECLFGEIVGGEMRLNPIGEIVKTMWKQLPQRFPDVGLDAFVVMPSHFHGIIVITENDAGVGAIHESPLPPNSELQRIQRRRMLLPKIVGYFKMNTVLVGAIHESSPL